MYIHVNQKYGNNTILFRLLQFTKDSLRNSEYVPLVFLIFRVVFFSFFPFYLTISIFGENELGWECLWCRLNCSLRHQLFTPWWRSWGTKRIIGTLFSPRSSSIPETLAYRRKWITSSETGTVRMRMENPDKHTKLTFYIL